LRCSPPSKALTASRGQRTGKESNSWAFDLAFTFNAGRLQAPLAFEGAEQRSRGVARAARFLF
jgi:preprotein translocase subunit SecD